MLDKLHAVPLPVHAEVTVPCQYGQAWIMLSVLLGCGGVHALEPTPEETTPFNIDGWIEGGSFLSLHGRQGVFNFGPTDAVSAQEVHLNQLYLRTAYSQKLGWGQMGMTVHNLFGTDWNNTYTYGFLDDAFRWNQPGWNLPQAFVTAETASFSLDVGKIYTPYGYEDVQAPERPLYSTGYLYNFIYPTTQTGLAFTWKGGHGFSLYQGLINAPDLWIFNRFEPNYIAGFTIESSEKEENNFSFYLNYGRGLMRMATVMMSGVPAIHTDLDTLATPVMGNILLLSENWQMQLDDGWSLAVDLTQGTVNDATTLDDEMPGTDGSWLGGSLWLEKDWSDQITGIVRCEWLQNSHGIATGYPGSLFETTVGIAVRPMNHLTLRPELRYDRALDSTPFLDASAQQLFSLNIDAILQY